MAGILFNDHLKYILEYFFMKNILTHYYIEECSVAKQLVLQIKRLGVQRPLAPDMSMSKKHFITAHSHWVLSWSQYNKVLFDFY